MTYRTAISTLCIMAAWTSAARAQPSIQLSLEDSELFVNEPITVAVSIDNFRECSAPEFPQIDGCSVRALPNASRVSQSIINGRVSTSRTFYFELTPTRAGQINIPPIKATADGKELATPSQTFSVKPSDADELFYLSIRCEDDRLYVGQQTTLVMTIWIRAARVRGETLTIQDMFRFVDRGDWGPFPLPAPPVRQEQRKGSDGKNHTYYGYDCVAAYTPTRPGPLTLDPFEVNMRYPIRFETDLFGQIGVSQSRRLRAVPRVDNVEVLPLPVDGRPDTFNGAIGRFNIQVRAEPTNVRVGDPIKLTIDLSGDGAVSSLGPPLLASMPALNDGFRVPREALAGEMKGGVKRFTQTIRAKRPGVTEIPPIDYPYFDTKIGQYVVARSEAIPIRVTPSDSLESSDLVGLKTPQHNTEPPATPLDGLRGNETSERRLRSEQRVLRLPHVAIATLAPPALFALSWIAHTLAALRAGDPAARRRGRALANARRRIDRAASFPPNESARELRAAMAGYLADRFNQPAGKFDGLASAELLRERGVDENAVREWADLIAACEQASFGGGANGDISKLADRAREQLDCLERRRI